MIYMSCNINDSLRGELGLVVGCLLGSDLQGVLPKSLFPGRLNNLNTAYRPNAA